MIATCQRFLRRLILTKPSASLSSCETFSGRVALMPLLHPLGHHSRLMTRYAALFQCIAYFLRDRHWLQTPDFSSVTIAFRVGQSGLCGASTLVFGWCDQCGHSVSAFGIAGIVA